MYSGIAKLLLGLLGYELVFNLLVGGLGYNLLGNKLVLLGKGAVTMICFEYASPIPQNSYISRLGPNAFPNLGEELLNDDII